MVAADFNDILTFWFGDALDSPEQVAEQSELWFQQSDSFDAQISARFRDLPELAARGELDAWQGQERSALALVLVLDQFPRNLHRGTARAFAYDPLACRLALDAIDRGFDDRVHPLEASFFYLPLEHAEDLALQTRCLELFGRLLRRAPEWLQPRLEDSLGYAQRHFDVIERFGRFPHRNAILKRPSSADETAFLEAGGDTFV